MGGVYGDFCHIKPLPLGLSFELQQLIIPQKTTFDMKIYDFENKNTV